MQALAALHLFIRDRHYVVQDGKVQIVDEHTGRIATGRAWQNGLHQLIEMKEGCATTERRATRASITYQRFFGRYLHLAGMSGTLAEVAAELRATYGLATIRIPTHRPARRTVMRARLYRTSIEKQRALVETVRAGAMSRRPILIGTASVEASEALSRSLAEAGVAHVTLNANHPEEEAAIIAEAGQIGRVTVATNMAGRGTDILLGPGVADRGGLHVILTEYHSSSRIDRQFVGRGGRQGDPAPTKSSPASRTSCHVSSRRKLQISLHRSWSVDRRQSGMCFPRRWPMACNYMPRIKPSGCNIASGSTRFICRTSATPSWPLPSRNNANRASNYLISPCLVS